MFSGEWGIVEQDACCKLQVAGCRFLLATCHLQPDFYTSIPALWYIVQWARQLILGGISLGGLWDFDPVSQPVAVWYLGQMGSEVGLANIDPGGHGKPEAALGRAIH